MKDDGQYLLIISNGHGEDAVGAILASKFCGSFENGLLVKALPLVGRGAAYLEKGIEIVTSFPSLPSEGLTKYGILSFFKDLRAGLVGQLREQVSLLSRIKDKVWIPLCVGDVFLAYLVFLGLKRKVLLLLVGRTVRTRRFSVFEKNILRKCTQLIWAKDEETYQVLSSFLPQVVYVGDPIMDLGEESFQECGFSWYTPNNFRVVILPGSRHQQLEKLPVLLEAAFLVSQEVPVEWVLVKAPGKSLEELASLAPDWCCDGSCFWRKNVLVRVFCGPLANVAKGADLVVGFGGTANQICAGFGVPVLALGGKEKKSQKKILGGAVKVVPPQAKVIKENILCLLHDPEERAKMSRIGREKMGPPGALDRITDQVEQLVRTERFVQSPSLPDQSR